MTRLETYIISRLDNLEWYIKEEIDPEDTRCRAHELKMLCEYSDVSEGVVKRAKMVYIKAVRSEMHVEDHTN